MQSTRVVARSLKITEEVAFNIASEASYVYILVAKSSLKMPKMAYFDEFLKIEACGQTVSPDMSLLVRQKLEENAKIEKIKCDIFE